MLKPKLTYFLPPNLIEYMLVPFNDICLSLKQRFFGFKFTVCRLFAYSIINRHANHDYMHDYACQLFLIAKFSNRWFSAIPRDQGLETALVALLDTTR
jgi:hypothetical protein